MTHQLRRLEVPAARVIAVITPLYSHLIQCGIGFWTAQIQIKAQMKENPQMTVSNPKYNLFIVATTRSVARMAQKIKTQVYLCRLYVDMVDR